MYVFDRFLLPLLIEDSSMFGKFALCAAGSRGRNFEDFGRDFTSCAFGDFKGDFVLPTTDGRLYILNRAVTIDEVRAKLKRLKIFFL